MVMSMPWGCRIVWCSSRARCMRERNASCACVCRRREREEWEERERETRVRVIHEFRVYSHIHVLCYAKNCRWHIGCEGRESATEIPLMCLSAVNVAYRNPVSRFRVATRRPLLVLSNVIKAPLFLLLNVPWASERINSQSCAIFRKWLLRTSN